MVSEGRPDVAPVSEGAAFMVMGDSRPAWLRWWHRKTIPTRSFEGAFILQTRITLSWWESALVLLGRKLVIEYRSEVEPEFGDDKTSKLIDSLKPQVWTQPRRW